MFTKILLCSDGSPGADGATRYALWLARQLKAHLLVLHITDIRLLEGPLLADLSGALGAQPYPALLSQFRELQQTRAGAILSTIVAQCRERGVGCETIHATGSLVHTLLEAEARADLVVLGQHGEHAQWGGGQLGSSVERMVRASTKPCLVVSEKFREPRHLLLAHDGSEESMKALYRGINLAVALQAAVTIVAACETGREDGAAAHLQPARELAETRGLKTHAQLVHAAPEQAILQMTDEVDADLVVMGAYGHTRIREWILGSVTSQVLRKSRVPVLLARGT